MSMRRDIILSRRPLAGFFAIGVAWSVYFAQMPVIKAAVGASDGNYGLALLLASFGAIAAMWLAPACRRLVAGGAVPLGILVLAAGMMGSGQAGSLVALGATMFLASVGSGVVDVLINARVAEIEEEAKTGLMNLNHALYSFAYTAGALATGAARSAGLHPSEICFGLVLVLLMLAWAARDVAPKGDATADAKIGGPSVMLVLLTGLIVLTAFLAEAATEGWSALHLERTLDGSAAEGAMGPAILGLTMGFGRLCGHGLSRRFRDTHLMLVATLISAAGILGAAFAPTVGTALLGFAVAGLGISVVVPLAMALIGRVVPPKERLAAISRASVIGYGAFFFGPSLMGMTAQGLGLPMAFAAVACLLCVTAAVLIPALARRAG